MAVHPILPSNQLSLLILCFVTAVVGYPAVRPELSHEISLQPANFPNERLYQAYLAIQRFKNSINSDPKNITATWSGNDICSEKTYLGFHCATPPGLDEKLTVTAVLFNGFGLHAPRLQGFADQLPDLAIFHASSNNFGGDIPHLDSLPYQFEFNTANYDIRRMLPRGRTSGDARGGIEGSRETDGKKPGNLRPPACTNTFLNITYHFRIGTPEGGIIPGVTDAKALILNYNNLSGKLPTNIGFFKLSYLALANNKLSGSIPTSIAQLQDSLLEVLLLNNQLSGCLPNELGMLTKTAVIDAGMNQLTGPIPSSFSCLSSVEQLNLAGNRLYGQVPDALCKLAGPAGRLSNLTLSSNYFTSVGPACSALIKDGVLDVKHNCIPGFANQRGPAECASFLSQPKTCPAASARVACPAADAKMNAPAPEGRVAKDYSSYVVYATLHE
ncbi:hypothetical protein CFC21_088409 [Triticum aestivum]|uniref:Leucine-rich repeat-containing N-terminal plant-type domain-containing protein n=2 Tax=Triticum aestivum TaxID=4565 RepID=A0A9R1IJJ3_WHEAT|nr:uncharacterized protein At4g06744-like [Triticum aestivum]KAF7084893.1 hypothetical protein CFC21_088409 [Triticum aestivum]